MLSEKQYKQAANCIKLLAHPIRLKIIDLLLINKEYRPGDLALTLKISNSLTSEHLKLLRLCNFVKTKRSGKEIFYQINELFLKDFIRLVYLKFGDKDGNKAKRTKK